MHTQGIAQALSKKVEVFADSTQALWMEACPCKDVEAWRLSYAAIEIEFRYIPKGNALTSPSTLYAAVSFGKNEASRCFFHLMEVIDAVEPSDYTCYHFPYIENEARLDACFTVLAEALTRCLPRLEALAADRTAVEGLVTRQLTDMGLDREEVQEPDDAEAAAYVKQVYDTQVIPASFLTKGYRAYLQGQVTAAVRYYADRAHKEPLLSHEQRLYAFLQTLSPDTPYQAIDPACLALKPGLSYEKVRSHIRGFL